MAGRKRQERPFRNLMEARADAEKRAEIAREELKVVRADQLTKAQALEIVERYRSSRKNLVGARAMQLEHAIARLRKEGIPLRKVMGRKRAGK